MTGVEPLSECTPPSAFWGRGEIVFAAAACALAAGVLIPMPGLLLDILWGVVLSLTLGAGLFFPAAASTADLKGFAAMLSGPALLRIGLAGAVCVRLTSHAPAGRLIPATGSVLTDGWPLGAAIVCLVAAMFLVVALFGACQRIAISAYRYKQRIYPLKYVGIETDVKLGVIDAAQARTLVERVDAEARLFANLTGASLLMRAEGVIEVAAVLVCLMWSFGGAERIAPAAASAVGLTVFSLVPAFVSALAGAYLAGKDSLTLRSAPTEKETAGRTFTLVDQETGQAEEVELLNPDFVRHPRQARGAVADERLAEFEPEGAAVLMETLSLSADSPHLYYRQLAGAVLNASAAARVVVFAARQVRQLPVTVFVNTAIQLAREGQKILLVDADTQRNALAQVFEADAVHYNTAAQPTGFEGLDLYRVGGDAERVRATLAEAAAGRYACVLIYAPDAEVQQILKDALFDLQTAAFLFGVKEGEPTGQIAAPLGYCQRLFLVSEPPMQTSPHQDAAG